MNVFGWILAHRKVLTSDNLKKRGNVGPSQCAMYLQSEEYSQHLFLDYRFAKETWKSVLIGLDQRVQWPLVYSKFMSCWSNEYQVSFDYKPVFRRIWESIPEYVMWKIWLAQNKKIFQHEKTPP